MAFITHCLRRARADLSVLMACALFGLWQPVALRAQPAVVEITQMDLSRNGDGVELAATVRFQLPPAVQDALYRGLPVIFVAEAEIYRERWYWDKRVGGAQRHMRLVYQPLSRRWRLSVGTGPSSGSDAGVALAQTFDTLDEALGVIRRVSSWRIADFAELETGSRHRLDLRFRLDIGQLPRPLQIGTLGESDWVLAVSASKRLQPESLK